MALKGEAKKTYQRNYMRDRRRRLKLEGTMLDPPTSSPVRPHVAYVNITYPEVDADGNVMLDYE